MRAILAAALLLVSASGCLFDHGTFHHTPCKPAGDATHGTLRVEVHYGGEHAQAGVTPMGRCVSLAQGEKVFATARIGEDGNGTLNLPVAGDVYIKWIHPWPQDRACAAQGYAFVTVPGPANVTLETGNVCY